MQRLSVSRALSFVVVGAFLAGLTTVATPLTAQAGPGKASAKNTAARKSARKKSSRRSSSAAADARTRANAIKKLNDYNYVKHFGPITGPMYRSTKW